MSNRRLQVFYTVAKLGNLTKAAHVLHMTQPAVTAQIQKFEEYYDIRLLERHAGGVSLTDVGRVAFRYAESISTLHDAMDHSLKLFRGHGSEASLRLAAMPGTSDFLLRVLVRGFRQQHGDVDVQVFIDDIDSIVYKLEKHAVDLALLEGEETWAHLQVEQRWKDPLAVIVSDKHPMAGADFIRLADLARYPLICRDDGVSLCDQLLTHYDGAAGESPVFKVYPNFGSLDAVIDAVHMEMGVAVIARTALQRLVRSADHQVLRLRPACAQRLSLVRYGDQPGPDTAQRMLDYVERGLQLPVDAYAC